MLTKLIVNFLFFGSLTILATSCAKTESENVSTKGIYASFGLLGNNVNSVNCSVQLQVGGPTGTFLDLSSGDSITCNGSNTMLRSELAGIITYSATLPYAVDVYLYGRLHFDPVKGLMSPQ